jgi:UDP-N-acetylmuramoyl-tripeptide--D-alanyl-D-alanine ligase
MTIRRKSQMAGGTEARSLTEHSPLRMEARSLAYACEACGGELRGGAPAMLFTGVSTDSRHAQPGDLFFALKGERFDGHNFVREARARGVAGVVVEGASGPAGDLGCPALVVDDTRRALGRLAARYRRDFQLLVLAVGGSNGKTTTKELLAAVLRQGFDTLASEASFNNDVGVPLTLLKLGRRHQAAVLEVGTNHPGELEPLVRMSQPRFGLLTNIAREHLEYFGDLPGVAREEGWLAELLPADGCLFLNGDGPFAADVERRCRAKLVRAGFGPRNDWRAEVVHLDTAGVTFVALGPLREFCGEYRLNLLGRHQVLNALLVLAAAAELGLKPEQIRRGLAACPPPKMRLQVWEARGLRVLDDAYNANADSTRAALETLRDLPCAGRRVAVLGDMAELGAHTTAAHREVGRGAAETGVNLLLAVGRLAEATAAAAREAGLRDVHEFPDVPQAAAALPGLLRPGDTVLIKASRAAAFERIAQALRQPAAGGVGPQ